MNVLKSIKRKIYGNKDIAINNVENKRIREINQAKMIDIKNNSNNKIS